MASSPDGVAYMPEAKVSSEWIWSCSVMLELTLGAAVIIIRGYKWAPLAHVSQPPLDLHALGRDGYAQPHAHVRFTCWLVLNFFSLGPGSPGLFLSPFLLPSLRSFVSKSEGTLITVPPGGHGLWYGELVATECLGMGVAQPRRHRQLSLVRRQADLDSCSARVGQ